MALLDRLKNRPPALDKLQADLATAAQALHDSEGAYRESCLAAANGGSAEQKARSDAEKELERARRNVRELEAAVQAAEQYEVEAEAQAAADEHERRLAVIREHATAREQAARDAEAAVSKLADAMDRVATASAAMADARPHKVQVDSAMLGQWDIEGALRLHMVKAGFAWAFSWPWGRQSVPAFTDKVQEGNAYLLNAAERANEPEPDPEPEENIEEELVDSRDS